MAKGSSGHTLTLGEIRGNRMSPPMIRLRSGHHRQACSGACPRPMSGVHERIVELRAHHAQRLDKLAEALAQPHSAAECFRYLFRREIHPGNLSLAIGEALAHLHLLEAEGRARREQDSDGVWRFMRA